LTSPAANATFTASTSVSIVASVADSDGRITRVRFYSGGQQIGSDSNGPTYSMTWRNVPAGTHTLTAVATDDDGARATSAAVTITVKR
jgi:chitinase